jgi:cellulose synthase/poly-beta-1,6-N-acetylglucosamine synthase-like glycosyltransferase
MIEIITLGCLALFSAFYIFFITRIRIGLYALRYSQPRSDRPMVSVIVAARNEAANIGRCLQALAQQTYAPSSFEIIVIDDGSTDDTPSIMKSYSERYSNIHPCFFSADHSDGQSRKPRAIEKGIELSKGEIILTTDADCLVPPRWIEIMINCFRDDVVFVAGPVVEREERSFFSRLEGLEFLGLVTTAAGLIGSGRPIICNGANIAYRKKAFAAVGGFTGDSSSNDDEFLMNKMVHRRIGRVVFAPDPDGVVVTSSANTVATFFRQRLRWANKRGHYEDKTIMAILYALYLFFLSVVVVAALIPREPRLILPLSLVLVGKAIVDFFTLRSGARLFRQRIPLFHFFVAELLHVPYIVVTAAVGQFISMHWKGRTVRR